MAEDPVIAAKNFEDSGALGVHIIDIDGAAEGKPVNYEIVFDIVKKTNLRVQVGGGIRDMDSADFYLSRGVDRIVLGSAAIKNKEFLKAAVENTAKK